MVSPEGGLFVCFAIGKSPILTVYVFDAIHISRSSVSRRSHARLRNKYPGSHCFFGSCGELKMEQCSKNLTA